MRASKSKRLATARPTADSAGSAKGSRIAEATNSDGQCVAVKVVRVASGHRARGSLDSVAREEPLEIRVRGRSIAVAMRTPGHDAELAAGFLLSEGLLHQRGDIIEIAACDSAATPENVLNVFLSPEVQVDFTRLTRHVFASSSCGLCGKASIDDIHQRFPPVVFKGKVSTAVLAGLPEVMRAAQKTFEATGGLHAAAIFDLEGNLVVLREDVGRHNAVDKVIGWAFLKERFPLDEHILLVSGRASFEIVQKASAGRIPVVAAVSAPSSLAVELANESGQTLVGFLRGKRMNIYSRR
jgi:FdhD protein